MSWSLVLDITLPLDRFTLAVRWETSGRSLGIFGPSGAGKTSILESLAGLRPAARGRIEVNGATWLDSERGVRLPPEERGVGYVPQEALLFPHRSVLGNLLAGRRRSGRSGARRLAPGRVMEVLELTALADRDVARLSGGEKQRVALGRALCSGPELLLLDEPLAALDLPLRRRILPYLLRVKEEFGVPTIHVSHDAADIRILTNEVIVLGAGRTVVRGTPDEVFTDPAVLPMSRPDGFENILRGRVTGTAGTTATVELEPGLSVTVAAPTPIRGSEAVIGVRAEDLILAVGSPAGLSAQNLLPGEVLEVHASEGEIGAAGSLLVLVALGRTRLPIAAAITPQARAQLGVRPGLAVHVICKAHALRVLATL